MPLENTVYVPTLAIRPSEMRGLEYLPQASKGKMSPCFLLAPWVGSYSIVNAVERLETAFGHGDYFLDIDRDYIFSNVEAPAQAELLRLMDPSNAFSRWCDFVSEHTRVMPCLQLRDQSHHEIRSQIDRYRNLERTFALRIFRDRDPINLDDAISALAADGAADFVVILEGGWARDALQLPAWFHGLIDSALAEINAAVPVVASCTTMPKAFGSILDRREIRFTNRTLLGQVQAQTNNRQIIYGDWASTRPREQRGGGGGPIPPRIDYPVNDAWWIYRNPDLDWNFQQAAERLVSDADVWDGNTGQWGEQMISETAINENLGINSLQKNVAVRVNLHLHRQAFYGTDIPAMGDFDDDWEDS
jgi:T4 beta protein